MKAEAELLTAAPKQDNKSIRGRRWLFTVEHGRLQRHDHLHILRCSLSLNLKPSCGISFQPTSIPYSLKLRASISIDLLHKFLSPRPCIPLLHEPGSVPHEPAFMPGRSKNGNKTRNRRLSKLNGSENPTTYPTAVDTGFSVGRDPSNTFKDMRSASKPKLRSKTRGKKYFGYDVVKPGQISRPHYEAPDLFGICPMFPADINECKVVIMDKKQFYKEAQITAPSYRRYSGCSCCSKWLRRASARERAAVKAEASDWDKRGERRDFAGNFALDQRNYDELAWTDVNDAMEFEWMLSCLQRPLAGYAWEPYTESQLADDIQKMVDDAIAALRTPVPEPGWEDLIDGGWSSPEMEWVGEGMELFEDEEDFELL